MKDKKKFKDTKVGKFITENAPNVLDIVDDYLPPVKIITELLRGENLPPEQRAELDKLLIEYEKEILKDKDSARNREIQINQSEYASWLAKNTASIIALAYTVFTFIIYILVLMGHLKAGDNISILIVNSITNIAMLIVGYYYGSSDRRNKALKDSV